MTLPLTLYRVLTSALSPFTSLIFKRRVTRGKEIAGRFKERIARDLPPRPSGALIWMHGASIGESKLLLGLSKLLAEQTPNLHMLFTSQTASSAGVIRANLPENAIHQLAPVDTPRATKRFIAHWQPDLCIFAEGEIWPNLLQASTRNGAKTALINARMTAKSLKGWRRFSGTARKLFSSFDLILAADRQTAIGLSQFTETPIRSIGNLKATLAAGTRTSQTPTPPEDLQSLAETGKVILGASTHTGEEELLLKALERLDTPAKLILAPRHIDRTPEIEALVKATGKPYALHSRGAPVSQDTDIILADTFGEMDLWYSIADQVYLGGSATLGIGGHNPLEPLSFGHNIIAGPHTDNFSDMYEELTALGWVHTVQTPEELAARLNDKSKPEKKALDTYFKAQDQPAVETLTALKALLSSRAAS